jgi:hypothetical protein
MTPLQAAKAIFTYAFDLEYVTSNVMQRYAKLQRVEGETKDDLGMARVRPAQTPRPLGRGGTCLSECGRHPTQQGERA